MTICVASISISPPIPFPSIFPAGGGRFLHPCPAAAKGAGATAAQHTTTGEQKERAETCRALKKTGWENYPILPVSEQICKPKDLIFSEIKEWKTKPWCTRTWICICFSYSSQKVLATGVPDWKREKKSKILDFSIPPQSACSSTYHFFRPIKHRFLSLRKMSFCWPR